MSEPRRWLDDPRTSAELRQILDAAPAPPPLPPELHARLAEYTVTLASHGLLAKLGGVNLWRKLLQALGGSSKVLTVASLVGASAAGGYVASRALDGPADRAARSPLAGTARARSTRAAGLEPVPSTASSASSPSEAPLVAEPSEPRAPKAARAIPSAPASAPASSDSSGESVAREPTAGESVAAEAKLLESARSFLGDSPALALELTEQHRRLHPAAQLSAEREFIAIEALLRLGRRQEAERRAAPRLEQAPDSLYARRLRQLLFGASSASSAASPNHEKQ